MASSAKSTNTERLGDYDSDEFEVIGTINYAADGDDLMDMAVSTSPDYNAAGITNNVTGDATHAAISQGSKFGNVRATDKYHTNQPSLMGKSSSFNGATLQELQLRRMENQAAADRQRLLQNRLRAPPLTPSAGNTQSTFSPHFVSPPMSKGDVHNIVQQTTTSLPAVQDATKRELLRLNQRYAPTNQYQRSKSHVMIQPTSMIQSRRSQQFVLDSQIENNEASPFKLILHGIGSKNNTSPATNVITPDKIQMRRTKSDLGPEFNDANYLLHLTQLARYANSGGEDTNNDDESSSSYESTSSSYASSVPLTASGDECIGSSEVRKQKLDGARARLNSYRSKMNAITTQFAKRVLQNRRLRKVASFIKQALIIFAIALFFAWLELAKDKIVEWLNGTVQWVSYLVCARIESIQDAIAYWCRSNKEHVLISASAWLQSSQEAITDWRHNIAFLVFDMKNLITGRIVDWRQRVFQSILAMASRVEQANSHQINATRELFRYVTTCENYRVCAECCRLIQRGRDIMLTTKHISYLVCNGLGLLYSGWVQEIDFSSLVIETLFSVRRLQLDCVSYYQNVMQKIRQSKETASVMWNSDVAAVIMEWRKFVPNTSEPLVGKDGMVLLKSRVTNHFDFPFNRDSINTWDNETATTYEATAEKEPMNGVILMNSPSFSLLRAPRYSHNPGQFRKNTQISPNGYGELLLNDYQHKLGAQGTHRGSNGHVSIPQKEHQKSSSAKDQAKKQYDSSFPTFLIEDTESRQDQDSFDSVNLMEMASQVTKRLLPRITKAH